MKHVRVEHDKNCECQMCIGGLFQCKFCRLAEGELTTDCTGSPVDANKAKAVYDGFMDFIDGQGWVAPPPKPLQRTAPKPQAKGDLQ